MSRSASVRRRLTRIFSDLRTRIVLNVAAEPWCLAADEDVACWISVAIVP